MKRLIKQLIALTAIVSAFSTPSMALSIFGTSIDAATLPAQLKQLEQMIKQVDALKEQIAAQTGIRDILSFQEQMINLHKIMHEYSVDFMDLTDDIIDKPRSQLGRYAKRLFEQYNLFDDCNYDYMSQDEKRICKSEMVRNVQEIATYQYTTERLKDIAQNIQKLVAKAQASEDIKQSADIANAIQVQMTQLQLIKTQIDMMEMQNRAKERVERRQSRQLMFKRMQKMPDFNF